ncbi:MAG: peptide deformylase [Candidatus Liptonbacteria bacterium]
METKPIVTITLDKDEKFLRRKAIPFEVKNGHFAHGEKIFSRTEINQLLMDMKKSMRGAHGVGLSANQIGLTYRLFVAEVPNNQGENKFYAIFNPELEPTGSDKEKAEEGCLSVPALWGEVSRYDRVILRGYDKNCRPLKIKAWALLARVFQHEMDHLNGTLFIDKAKNLHGPDESPAK